MMHLTNGGKSIKEYEFMGGKVYMFCLPDLLSPIKGDLRALACDEDGTTIFCQVVSDLQEVEESFEKAAEWFKIRYPGGYVTHRVENPPENWKGKINTPAHITIAAYVRKGTLLFDEDTYEIDLARIAKFNEESQLRYESHSNLDAPSRVETPAKDLICLEGYGEEVFGTANALWRLLRTLDAFRFNHNLALVVSFEVEVSYTSRDRVKAIAYGDKKVWKNISILFHGGTTTYIQAVDLGRPIEEAGTWIMVAKGNQWSEYTDYLVQVIEQMVEECVEHIPLKDRYDGMCKLRVEHACGGRQFMSFAFIGSKPLGDEEYPRFLTSYKSVKVEELLENKND